MLNHKYTICRRKMIHWDGLVSRFMLELETQHAYTGCLDVVRKVETEMKCGYLSGGR